MSIFWFDTELEVRNEKRRSREERRRHEVRGELDEEKTASLREGINLAAKSWRRGKRE